MSYTPPAGNNVGLGFTGAAYTPPPGTNVPLAFGAAADLPSMIEQAQGVDGAGEVMNPPPIYRGPNASFGLRWAAAPLRQMHRLFSSTQAPARSASVAAAWGAAMRVDAQADLTWTNAPRVRAERSLAWQDTEDRVFGEPAVAWQNPPAVSGARGLPWSTADATPRELGIAYRFAARKHIEPAIAWDLALRQDIERGVPWRYAVPAARSWSLPWNQAPFVPHGYVIEPPFIPPPQPVERCYNPPLGNATRMAFRVRPYTPPAGNQVGLGFRCRADNYYFIHRSRAVENTLTVVRLPAREPINVGAVSLSADLDSFVWSLSLRILDRPSLTLLLPDPDEGPHSVEIVCNGHVWTALVERYQDSRRFGDAQFSATGRSRAALLAAPYSAPRAYVSTEALNAQQLALRELEFSGFSLDWQAQDWLVPAGALAYDNLTPLDAVTQIANAIGATVQAAPGSDTVRVISRYPISPWQWDAPGAETAAILDAGSVVSIGLDWQPGAAYQGIYTSGRDQGVLVQVIRDGTAGTPYAALVVDPLITAVEHGTVRGRVEIARAEDAQVINLVLPLLPDPEPPGLLQPGALIEVQDPVWGTYRALVTATAIEASREPSQPLIVRQRITIRRQFRAPS